MNKREAAKFLLEFCSSVHLHNQLGSGTSFDFDYAKKLVDALDLVSDQYFDFDYAKKLVDALDLVLDQYIVVPDDGKIPNEPGQVLVDCQKTKHPYVHRKKVNKNGK
jgi:hypothetical protein